MRVIEQTIYKYSELEESAKARAREWFSDSGYSWTEESMASIEAFCDHYNVKISDYCICPYRASFINTNAENSHFRGLTLKQVEAEKDLMPTGYCIDNDLFRTMYKAMTDNGGNALQAFKDAIDAGLKAMIADMEYQDSEEYIEEMMAANDYEFDEMGRVA